MTYLKRIPAAVLSVLVPGLGHMALKRIRKGFLYFFACEALFLLFILLNQPDIPISNYYFVSIALLSIYLCVRITAVAECFFIDPRNSSYSFRNLLVAGTVLGFVCVNPTYGLYQKLPRRIEPFKIAEIGKYLVNDLRSGDLILINRQAYKEKKLQKNDLALFRTEGGKFVLSEIIALQDERIAPGRLLIPVVGADQAYERVPEGRILARSISTNTYVYLLPENQVVGKAEFRYWPLYRIGKITEARPSSSR